MDVDDMLGPVNKDDVKKRLDRQRELPAIFDATGSMHTMAEAVNNFRTVKEFKTALGKMTARQKQELATARICSSKDFKIGTPGKVYDQRAACKEVQAGTGMGKSLVSTEMLAIEFAFAAIKKEEKRK